MEIKTVDDNDPAAINKVQINCWFAGGGARSMQWYWGEGAGAEKDVFYFKGCSRDGKLDMSGVANTATKIWTVHRDLEARIITVLCNGVTTLEYTFTASKDGSNCMAKVWGSANAIETFKFNADTSAEYYRRYKKIS